MKTAGEILAEALKAGKDADKGDLAAAIRRQVPDATHITIGGEEVTDITDYPDYDDDGCYRCGGEGIIITCCDDLCVAAGSCMHGDGEEICPDCKGESL